MKNAMRSLALTLLLCPLTCLAEKTDIVTLINGDRITGEIKKLEAGLLEYSTDTMGTVYVEWRFIAEITSDKSQAVELADGARVIGSLQKPEGEEHLQVNTASGPVDVQPEDVVSAWPVEAGFRDRMDLDVSFGIDFRSATDITTIDGAVDFRARGNDRLSEASLRTNITRQPDDDDEDQLREQRRYELEGFHEYLLANQRFRRWFGKIESNDATSVDLRLSGGAAFGKYMLKTNNKWFTVAGGLLATRENPGDTNTPEPSLPLPDQEPLPAPESESNLELVGSLRYRYFRFADPERSFDTSLSVYPSLTDSGRLRAELRSTFKLELVEDLFWSMELWGTHDNEPLDRDAEKTDYGIITSVGWSF